MNRYAVKYKLTTFSWDDKSYSDSDNEIIILAPTAEDALTIANIKIKNIPKYDRHYVFDIDFIKS